MTVNGAVAGQGVQVLLLLLVSVIIGTIIITVEAV
jgi:hypothetical protein